MSGTVVQKEVFANNEMKPLNKTACSPSLLTVAPTNTTAQREREREGEREREREREKQTSLAPRRHFSCSRKIKETSSGRKSN